MDRAVGEPCELVVVAWYVVECLSDVSSPLQYDLLYTYTHTHSV